MKLSDPVDVVNAQTWRGLDPNMIDRFQDRYSDMIRSYDGIITTYPPAFAELYTGLDRPQLVVAATRYEAPYSGQPRQWDRLNAFLLGEVAAGRMTVAANNRGDADYLRFHTGLNVDVVPSVCDYQDGRSPEDSGRLLVMARPGPARERILEEAGPRWRTVETALGRPFSWSDLSAASAIFVLPYNASTMSMFELATAGVRVLVPSRRLLHELRASDESVLGELSFLQIERVDTAGRGSDDPSNYRSPLFIDWWLDRADFFDPMLMPNVFVVDSLEQLRSGEYERGPLGSEDLAERNARLRALRSALVRGFLGSLG